MRDEGRGRFSGRRHAEARGRFSGRRHAGPIRSHRSNADYNSPNKPSPSRPNHSAEGLLAPDARPRPAPHGSAAKALNQAAHAFLSASEHGCPAVDDPLPTRRAVPLPSVAEAPRLAVAAAMALAASGFTPGVNSTVSQACVIPGGLRTCATACRHSENGSEPSEALLAGNHARRDNLQAVLPANPLNPFSRQAVAHLGFPPEITQPF